MANPVATIKNLLAALRSIRDCARSPPPCSSNEKETRNLIRMMIEAAIEEAEEDIQQL